MRIFFIDGDTNQCMITPKFVVGNVLIGTAMEIVKKYGLTNREFKVPFKYYQDLKHVTSISFFVFDVLFFVLIKFFYRNL